MMREECRRLVFFIATLHDEVLRPPIEFAQYTSDDYRRELKKHGIEVSMSRRGNCWDNAVAESFFATLKTELVFRQRWSRRIELREAVFDFIEVFYNRQRLHSSLDYKTPAQVEAEFALAA